jgi:hypothetical protein
MAATRHEARGTAREPDGRNAGTTEIDQQDSLHSKHCNFVEYSLGYQYSLRSKESHKP